VTYPNAIDPTGATVDLTKILQFLYFAAACCQWKSNVESTIFAGLSGALG
jgi:hypothetical protein